MDRQESGARKIRVAMLFGGRSDEHDVSLRSAETIIGALDPEKYEIVPVGISRDGKWLSGGDPLAELESGSPLFQSGCGSDSAGRSLPRVTATDLVPTESTSSVMPASVASTVDIVFPVLHGPMGEDGTVQGMLELVGVPYVGSGVLGSAVAMDKATTKSLLAQAGLPQLPWRLIHRKDWERDAPAISEWVAAAMGFPCFVKPANLGSSVGISKVNSVDSLDDAMKLAGHYDRKIILERGTNAREIEMAVLGNDEPMASVAGEVVPHGEFYDYNAKYVEDTAELIVPANIDPDLLAYLQGLAIDAFRALDLAGMARVDFFVERETDHVYVNEVNTIPGFTPISMYPMLWEASGLPLPDLVERLIQLALERYADTH